MCACVCVYLPVPLSLSLSPSLSHTHTHFLSQRFELVLLTTRLPIRVNGTELWRKPGQAGVGVVLGSGDLVEIGPLWFLFAMPALKSGVPEVSTPLAPQ